MQGQYWNACWRTFFSETRRDPSCALNQCPGCLQESLRSHASSAKGPNTASVSLQRLAAARQVPPFDGTVVIAAADVGAKRADCVDITCMALECLLTRTIRCIPSADGAVPTAAAQDTLMDTQTAYGACMPIQGAKAGTRAGLPKLDRLVEASRAKHAIKKAE